MQFYYSTEKNVQIIISLLKAHGVRKVVTSPGATNICLIQSMRCDGHFEIYSSVDERSAAYIACGLAEESGEPVALTCTGATASRNYLPGLTEAYYRRLPVIALTAALHEGRIGQNVPQVIDRRTALNDAAIYSVHLPLVQSDEDEWANNLKVNNALIACTVKKGPVIINWTTECSIDFSAKSIPERRIIKLVSPNDELPAITCDKVGIFIGSHAPMSKQLEEAIDRFCEIYNGVVLVDQTSNYRGRYRILGNLITYQELNNNPLAAMPLLIYLGNVSGAYMKLKPQRVWRVAPDGESRDCFKKVCFIFQMNELDFFEKYNKGVGKEPDYYCQWKASVEAVRGRIPELPFSNLWIAKTISMSLPVCTLHLGILNSLRSWNFFETPAGVSCFSNTGGFGIDGGVSTMIGASLVHPDKLYFGVFGDLAFFYDMNAIGNRHVGKNLRLIIVNNGKGTEFRNYNHNGAIFAPEETDLYIAAAGHYGNQSKELLKHYSSDLGFEYMCASNTEEFLAIKDAFLDPEIRERSILLEVFTNSEDESMALKLMNTIDSSIKGTAKHAIKKVLPTPVTKAIKAVLSNNG